MKSMKLQWKKFEFKTHSDHVYLTIVAHFAYTRPIQCYIYNQNRYHIQTRFELARGRTFVRNYATVFVFAL